MSPPAPSYQNSVSVCVCVAVIVTGRLATQPESYQLAHQTAPVTMDKISISLTMIASMSIMALTISGVCSAVCYAYCTFDK